ncbi:5973_t:CDS:2, partial [Funneliformis geosporum]
YQQLIRSKWLYKLIYAEQYLERKDIHIQFIEWFLTCLKAKKKIPKAYIKIKFLIGYDSELQIISTQDFISINLLPGQCTYQMSDFVVHTIMRLQNIVKDPYSFFKIELLEDIDLLNDYQINKIILDLKHGILLLSVPSLRKLCYMKFLKLDIECDESNDFDLSAILRDPIFNYEFYQFIQEQNSRNQLSK